MIAIILAAGSGKRLKLDKPKGLLNIGYQPLIQYSVNALEKTGLISKILIVTGYHSEKYATYFKKKSQSISVNLIYNEKYAHSGSLHSLYLAIRYVYMQNLNEDVIILDSDILYDFNNFNHFLLDREKNSIMTSNVIDGRYDACYVDIDGKGYLNKISKDINYINPSDKLYWEHIGIVKSSKETIPQLLKYADGAMKSIGSLNSEYDYAFENIGTKYKIVKYSDYLWSEVDDDIQLAYMVNIIFPKLNIF